MVVIIVSILVAIAHAALRTSREDAKSVKIEAALRKVDEAKIRYYMDTRPLNPAEPSLAHLAPYLAAGGAGEEIFYTKAAWETAHPPSPTAGWLLNRAIPGKANIAPNAREVPASINYW